MDAYDPAPLHSNYIERASSQMCHVTRERIIRPGTTVIETCGNRRQYIGDIYACPVCDATDRWTKKH